jgi:hypothetical protein
VRLTQGPPIHVSRAVKRALEDASITAAAYDAAVFDTDGEPALLLIAGDDLVLVRRGGVHRWSASELDRVEHQRILARDGTQVPISSWDPTPQAEVLRAGLRAILGQSEPQLPSAVETEREPPRRRRSLSENIAITLGVVILSLISLLIILRASGWTLQIHDETSGGWSEAKTFHETLNSMPAGTRLYWLGPGSGAFRLMYVQLAFEGDPDMHGAQVVYGGGRNGAVTVTTYVGLQRPEPAYDAADPTRTRVIARLVTPSHQLVVLTCPIGFRCASAAEAERLEHALRPVKAAEIDRLPTPYSEIPVS